MSHHDWGLDCETAWGGTPDDDDLWDARAEKDQDEDHDHVWGPVMTARWTGTAHRPCLVPGCRCISLDRDDEPDTTTEEDE